MQVSHLLAAGHTEAQQYPIWMVWFENLLVVERTNTLIATKAIVFHAALSTTAMTKDGGRKAIAHFQKLIKGLTEDS